MVALKFLKWLIFLAILKTGSSFDLYQEFKKLDFGDIQFNSTCLNDINLTLSAIAETPMDNLWALTMLDSSAKVPNGLIGGNLFQLGQFDECQAVVHPDGNFAGQHCIAMIDLNENTDSSPESIAKLRKGMKYGQTERNMGDTLPPLRYGICIPSTCSPEDMNKVLAYLKIPNVLFADKYCWTDEPFEFSSGSWGVISLIIVLVVVALCSTIYELYQIHMLKNENPKSILAAFSLYTNTINLFEIRDGTGDMSCLHGLRTLSMMWVVLGHTFEAIETYPVMNIIAASGAKTDPNFIIVTNGYFSVDSFFFLSGLLVAFVFFRNISKNGYYDAPVNYIHRYIRLTPSLLLIVLFNMTLLRDLSKGPQWGSLVEPFEEDCQTTWWSYLLYVQNYAKIYSNCVGQAWYLSCDMQMFWIAPLVLYPIYFWPKSGTVYLAILTIGSTLLAFGLALDNGFRANMTVRLNDNQFYYDYVTTHTRITPWLVGICLGVAICAIKSRKIEIRLSKWAVILGWVLSTSLCLGILYSFCVLDDNHSPSDVESAIYLSFTRLGWGIGLTWVLFACIYGYGGWVNSFLSLGIFQPLGKLSYNVYLIHITFFTIRGAMMRTNYNFDNISIAFEFVGGLAISHLVAIFFYYLLDAPFAIIDRHLLSDLKIFPLPRPQKEEMKEEHVENGETNKN